MDDDVETAHIYRCDGKVGHPIIRPCKNHDLAYGMGTYTDGESMETTNTVKSSSYIWIIGYKFQNPGNTISTYGVLSDLGLDQLQHP